MNFKKNKKGFAPIMIGVIMAVALLALLIFSLKSVGKSATSNTPVKVGCQPSELKAEVFGSFIVIDGAVLGIEPKVDRIDNIGIRAFRLSSLEPFNYEVELFDKDSGYKLDSIKGNNKLPSDVKELKIPFTLYYKIADNNCDNLLDDTQLTIRITVIETEDIFKDTSIFENTYTIKNGKIQ